MNMLPDPGDQMDALWAQRVAENTGYSIFMPQPMGDNFGALFVKRAHQNAIRMIMIGHGPTPVAGTAKISIWNTNGAIGNNGTAPILQHLSYPSVANIGSLYKFELDISSLSNGSVYSCSAGVGALATTIVTDDQLLHLISGIGAPL